MLSGLLLICNVNDAVIWIFSSTNDKNSQTDVSFEALNLYANVILYLYDFKQII